MNSEKKKNQKKVNTAKNTDKKYFDTSRFIICQCQPDTTVTSTNNGRHEILEAAGSAC